MNKKLNTIALATSLASLGFCSLTFGWQTDANSLVGTGVAGNSQPQVSIMLPPIVSVDSAKTPSDDNLPPIITGTLIRQTAAQGPAYYPPQAAQAAGIPTQELQTFTQGAGLKPLNSIMSPSSTLKAPNAYRPPAPPEPKTPAPVARVAKAAQGSGSRSFSPGSGSRAVSQGSGSRSVLSSIGQDYANASQGQQDFLPGSSPAGSGSGSRSFDSEQFSPSGDFEGDFNQNNFDQGFNDGSNFDQTPSVDSNCDTCGNSLVDGACSTCGPGAGYTDGPIITDYGTFGSVSAANRYLYLDALVWTRGDGDISNSNFGTLNDFDFTGGIRGTLGTRADSIFGTEISFLALPSVDQEISNSDPLIQSPGLADVGGRLSVIGLPVSGAPSDAFFGATDQTQEKESDLYSIEFNRVNWGWDLVKTFSGFRFIRFDDSYSVTSTGTRPQLDAFGNPLTSAGGNTVFEAVDGDFTLDAANTLLGGQVGGELFYDIGYRWSFSGFGKFGLFANFNDFDINYNNDTFNSNSESDSVTLSSVLELGILAHYQIRTNLRFRAGYSGMAITNVSTVADNFDPFGGATAGLFGGFEATDSDDIAFHGFNFGLEFYR